MPFGALILSLPTAECKAPNPLLLVCIVWVVGSSESAGRGSRRLFCLPAFLHPSSFILHPFLPLPTILTQSGITTVAGQSITFSATPADFELVFPYDLKRLCDAYLSTLDIEIVHPEFTPNPSADKFLMISLSGFELSRQAPLAVVTVDFICEKPRAQGEAYNDSLSVTSTLSKLRRLLTANQKFGGNVGVHGLEELTINTNLNYLSPFESPDLDREGGNLRAVWSVVNTSLCRTD